MIFYAYIIQSQKDKSYYVGYSNDLKKMLAQHNKAKSGYTSKKKPWKLVYTEGFKTKYEALEREKELKKQKSDLYYHMLIEASKGGN